MSLLMLSSAFGAPVSYTTAQLDMEIKSLPGAPKDIPFKQFGGYISVGGHGKIFFWFVESQSAPATDPVLMWTNGGPGCSGLTGFFTEHGPLYPKEDGSLALNDYAWNKAASMFYVEQPVGVGYSVADGEMQYGDAQAAADNLELVAGFFKLFPQFNKSPFFITSESYGGHYMPTLADALVTNGSVSNFGGFMVGNPLTYLTYRNYGEYGTAYGHQLLPKPLWEKYLAAGCDKAPGLDPGAACQKIEDQMEGLIGGLDPYGLDFPKCNDSALAKGRHERWTLRQHLLRARGPRRDSSYPYFPSNYQPCTSDWATTYLSRKDVQAAVHAQPGERTRTRPALSSCSVPRPAPQPLARDRRPHVERQLVGVQRRRRQPLLAAGRRRADDAVPLRGPSTRPLHHRTSTCALLERSRVPSQVL